MTRSAYATTSSLSVECPTCHAEKYAKCRSVGNDAITLDRCHSARRKAADDKRTADVNPETKKP